jgi:hypothetical protein
MEPDFVTRQHLDSLNLSSDPSTFELLNKYKFPPADPKPQMQGLSGFSGPPPQQYNNGNANLLFGNMLGQIQGVLQQMGNSQKQPSKSSFDGLQLSVNSDILRWVVLLVILIVLIWVVLKILDKRRKNPMRKRMKKLEKKLRKLKMYRNPTGATAQMLKLSESKSSKVLDDTFEDDEEADEDDEFDEILDG